VVVVGGIGSLGGAFLASLLIGLMQTFAVGLDVSVAPVLPYLLMVLVLIFRPRGLLGARGD
jgi:branched-subunit amino acid ABC-type transport system permease component